MSLFDKTLNQFVDEAASKSPTPGGGSVSAVAAACAAAMVSMVANLTANRKGYEAHWSEAEAILAQSTQRIAGFKQLAEDDIAAFSHLMKAWKSKTADENRLLEAVQTATEVPLCIARECLTTLKLAHTIAAFRNRNAISDVGVAACLSFGALESALLNVDINLLQLRDQDVRGKVQRDRDAILDEAKSLKERTLEVVSRTMA